MGQFLNEGGLLRASPFFRGRVASDITTCLSPGYGLPIIKERARRAIRRVRMRRT
jgi:hypothetical protein